MKTAMEKRLINIAIAEKCGWVVPDSWINRGRLEDNNERYLSDIHVKDKSTGWNAFHDNGNCFGLMVRLNIGCRFNEALNQAFAWSISSADPVCINAEEFESKEAALRYAITMCAYERL